MDSSPDPRRAVEGVLVVGAGGFLGSAVVRALRESGYPVRGLVRSPGGADVVRAAGGRPVHGDILDRESLRGGMEGCRSVIHLAATYPERPEEAEAARRVRVEGTQNLVAVARQTGVRRLLVGSGYWVYADQPGTLSDDSALDPRGESKVNRDAELAGLAAHEPGTLEVLVVRPGMVYGDGSWFRAMVESIREGTYRVVDGGQNYWSLVERSDTAAAFRSVLESGRGGATYLVVDDAPIRLRELVNLLAGTLGARNPEPVDPKILRGEVGDDVVHHLSANRAGSNVNLRSLGWIPRYPDCRSGLPVVLRAMGGGSPPPH